MSDRPLAIKGKLSVPIRKIMFIETSRCGRYYKIFLRDETKLYKAVECCIMFGVDVDTGEDCIIIN